MGRIVRIFLCGSAETEKDSTKILTGTFMPCVNAGIEKLKDAGKLHVFHSAGFCSGLSDSETEEEGMEKETEQEF